jgi:hypothetical protein
MEMGMSKRRSPPLTSERAARIKRLSKEQPDLLQHQIAAMVDGLNQGRVSEVLSGKRYREVPPA